MIPHGTSALNKRKTSILTIMMGYFPGRKYGGPPVSIRNFCRVMTDYEVYIVTTNHDHGEKQTYTDISDGWNDRQNEHVLYLSDKEFTSRSFQKIITEVNPDFIWIQDLFQRHEIPTMRLAYQYNIPMLIAPRGELCGGAIRRKYPKKKAYLSIIKHLPYIRDSWYQSTSLKETKGIIKYLGIPEERILCLPNISLPDVQKDECGEKKSPSGKLVYLSRITPQKNLMYLLHVLHNMKRELSLDIYGVISDQQYWDKCLSEIKKMPENVAIRYHGGVSLAEVQSVFAQYDAFVLPTRSENFGHAISESLMAGCPVILPKGKTPWDDGEGKGVFLYSPDDEQSMKESIETVLDMDKEVYAKISEDSHLYAIGKNDIGAYKSAYDQAVNRIMGVLP